MELYVDKHLKIDKFFESIYSSLKPHPVKVVDTALSETMKVDEIASKTAKTGKAMAVGVEMSIFNEKRCKLWGASLGNEKPSHQKTERANFPEENTCRLRSLNKKTRNGRTSKKLAHKLKK